MRATIEYFNGLTEVTDFHTIVQKDGGESLRVWHSDPDHPSSEGNWTDYHYGTVIEVVAE